MKKQAKAMVIASFAADALALGVHWIYSTRKIAEEYGRVEQFLEPGPDSHHSTKKAGEFTHYGDQAFVLLESIAHSGMFDPEDFTRRWQDLFREYAGYHDQATKGTLANLAAGEKPLDAGSSSQDMSGASRIAPLVYLYQNSEEKLVEAARTQTAMTHRNRSVIDASEFFARVAYRVLRGERPSETVARIAKEFFQGTVLEKWTAQGMASSGEDTVETIKTYGQSCHVPDAFPGVIHLICRYEDNLKESIIQCVMAGGDSAGRGMVVGMVLGAHLGMDALPPAWIDGLRKGMEIDRLLDQISTRGE
ncbi:MAG: ADP-ribosylglycohydrolase family protein [Desulfomonilia bacterium]